ncbi:DUF1501 domain-containing protein [bacterium]|nr:DUF1501 domain-containing protein [bacterium]
MNSFTRRSLMRAGLTSAPLISVGTSTLPLFLSQTARAAETPAKGEKILVVIQLLGGNDGLNTVVPHKIDGYARGRRGLRIPAASLVKLSDEIGLHPGLKPMEKSLESGRLAVIQGVGYPNPDRSHFRSMDIWESARLDPNDLATGWLGRAMDSAAERSDAAARINGVHIGARNLPLALRARRVDIPSLERLDQLQIKGDNTLTRIAADVDRLRLAETNSKAPEPAAPMTDNPLLGFVARTTATAVASSKKLADLDTRPGSVKYPESGLSSRLQLVSRMIKSGLDTRVFYTSLEGFDTHANQLNVHAGLLGQLGSALAAFEADMAEAGQTDRVAVLVFSEFGRRLAENASLGTDHGAAAPVFMTGTLARKGLVGAHPSMDPKDLNDGDVMFHTDFRRIYADILAKHLGVDPAAVLGGGFEPLGVLA